MRMQSKVWLFYGLVAAGAISVGAIQSFLTSGESSGWAIYAVIAGLLLQFYFLRCPHCSALVVMRSPFRMFTFLVGDQCERCGRAY